MLVPMREILEAMDRRRQAVAAFNVYNLESLQAVLEASRETGAPVVVATTPKALRYAGEAFAALLVEALRNHSLPVALHLDHGKTLEDVVWAIRHGWTSVMMDASHLPFEENVALTRKAVEVAHAVGVTVEGEIGVLAGVEDDVQGDVPRFTDPEEAARFVEATGVDALAVAVGTSHGAYKFKGEPRLDFDRIQAIRDRVPAYLVLHGASGVPQDLVARAERYGARLAEARGVPDSMLQEAVRRGIRKVNTDTDLRLAFTAAVRAILTEHPGVFDPRAILGAAREAMKETAIHRIRVLQGGMHG